MGKKKKEGTKFILLKDGSDEYTLIGEDGGYAGFHHNDECIVGTYYGRLKLSTVIKKGLDKAVDELLDEDDSRSLFDFEGHDDFDLCMVEEVADWMIFPRDGEVLDNLKYFESNAMLSEAELVKFLKNKEKEYRHLFY
jgi:hypothetical protein